MLTGKVPPRTSIGKKQAKERLFYKEGDLPLVR
jgi:hypothetical protein